MILTIRTDRPLEVLTALRLVGIDGGTARKAKDRHCLRYGVPPVPKPTPTAMPACVTRNKPRKKTEPMIKCTAENLETLIAKMALNGFDCAKFQRCREDRSKWIAWFRVMKPTPEPAPATEPQPVNETPRNEAT